MIQSVAWSILLSALELLMMICCTSLQLKVLLVQIKNIEKRWTVVKFKRPLSVNLLCLPFLFEKKKRSVLFKSIWINSPLYWRWWKLQCTVRLSLREKDTIATKLADIMVENSEAILLNCGRNLSGDFGVIYIFL